MTSKRSIELFAKNICSAILKFPIFVVLFLYSLHIPGLYPPGAVELDVSELVQNAAMVGTGILYQGIMAN